MSANKWSFGQSQKLAAHSWLF